MKRSRFSEEQITAILKEQEVGVLVSELCRTHGVSDASIYKWKAKYGGMDASEANRLKSVEDENARLKRRARTGCERQRCPKEPTTSNHSHNPLAVAVCVKAPTGATR